MIEERILEAAAAVAKLEGPVPSVKAVIELAGVSSRTLYRHFPSQHALALAIAREQRMWVIEGVDRVVKIEDANEALREWMSVGFGMVERFGLAALHLTARHRISREIVERVKIEEVYRFTGRLLKDWDAQGYAIEGIDVRDAVRTWFALVTPRRVVGAVKEGATVEQVCKETARIFWAAYARRGIGYRGVFPRTM